MQRINDRAITNAWQYIDRIHILKCHWSGYLTPFSEPNPVVLMSQSYSHNMAPTLTPNFGILFLDFCVDRAAHTIVQSLACSLSSTLGEPDVERAYDVDAVVLHS